MITHHNNRIPSLTRNISQEIEHLLIDLLILKYLGEKYLPTAYSTNVYIICGQFASILLGHTKQSLENAPDLKIESVFRRKIRKTRGKAPLSSKAAGKKRRNATDSDDDERENIEVDLCDQDDDYDDEKEAVRHSLPQAVLTQRRFVLTMEDTDSDEDTADNDWSVSFRKKGPPPKKPRISATNSLSSYGKIIEENNREVLVLSDD